MQKENAKSIYAGAFPITSKITENKFFSSYKKRLISKSNLAATVKRAATTIAATLNKIILSLNDDSLTNSISFSHKF